MISKEIIIKSLDDAIVKCSQGYSLNNKVTASFDKFHDKTCGKKLRKTELGCVTDDTGNVLYNPKGNKHELNKFSWTTVYDLYDEHGELHLTHNHPRDNVRTVAECLSSGDIDCLFETYRPYGKREDGSEGYLVGEEGIFPLKSISCESGNGTRMTLVRGDNFKHENISEAEKLGRELSDYWYDYHTQYYELASKIVSDSNILDFPNANEFNKYVHNEAIKKVGVFEKNSQFKDIQKKFSKVDCKLTYNFVDTYKIGMDEGIEV